MHAEINTSRQVSPQMSPQMLLHKCLFGKISAYEEALLSTVYHNRCSCKDFVDYPIQEALHQSFLGYRKLSVFDTTKHPTSKYFFFTCFVFTTFTLIFFHSFLQLHRKLLWRENCIVYSIKHKQKGTILLSQCKHSHFKDSPGIQKCCGSILIQQMYLLYDDYRACVWKKCYLVRPHISREKPIHMLREKP